MLSGQESHETDDMKRIFATIIAVCAAMMLSARDKSAELKTIPFADPFILYDGGSYYLYGTGSGDGIAVVVSKDMKSWEWPEGKEMYVAMHKDDSYGDKWFWAPEVYKVAGRYIMYYSAEEHICMAEAESPLGPFRQKVRKPMREHNGIDNHLFIEKKQIGERVETTVRPLDMEERAYEIARIMGGSEITEKLLSSAKELINQAKI